MIDRRLLIATVLVMAFGGAAVADDAASAAAPSAPAPPPKPPASLTLPRGALEVTVNLEVNASADSVAKPVSIAPDVSYGVTPDVTLMVVHSRYALTGLRGAAGGGLCVTGTDNGCAHPYDNLGAEGLISLAKGPLSIAANVGFHVLSFDRGFYAGKVGARLRYTSGRVGFTTLPVLFVAVTHRPDDSATTPLAADNPDRFFIPVVLGVTATPELWLGAGAGLKGPLQELGDNWQLAVGGLAQYKISPELKVGTSLIFGQIVGGNEMTSGADYRWWQLWVTYTR